jgi:ubiquinone/menaquinone biosynthesis C-methylase UbiE
VKDEQLSDAVDEVRNEYGRRAAADQCAGIYSFLNPTHAWLVFDREREILRALDRHLPVPLAQARVLDLGTGTGVSLAFLAAYGASATNLYGADIDAGRIARGREQFPSFDLELIDGDTQPYADRSFDVVQQITVFSSIHSEPLRRRLAEEMTRILRPEGLVLSYDVDRVGMTPRILNRALRALALVRRRKQRTVERPALVGAPVSLTANHPLTESELRDLFPTLETIQITRLTPYRPLVERFAGSQTALGLLQSQPALSSALLFVAKKS